MHADLVLEKPLSSTLTSLDWLKILLLVGGGALLLASYWSPAPFWIDAAGYTYAVSNGLSVVHPPGYIGFLFLADLIHGTGVPSYRALQIISATSYFLSIPFVYAACKVPGNEGSWPMLWAAVYAGSWICLNLASVGTSHSTDLLFGAIIAWLVTLPGRAVGRSWWYPVFFLTCVVTASFRLSTLVMFAPLTLLLIFSDFRKPGFWISGAFAAVAIGAILGATVQAYGGWENYRAMTAELNTVNAKSSLLAGGNWKISGVNLVRAGLWSFMAAPVILIVAGICWWRGNRRAGRTQALILLAAMVFGCLVINFGYLCTHPGYFTPMLAATIAIFPRLVTETRMIGASALIQIAVSVGLFFTARPVQPSSTALQAVANAWILQYGAQTQRNANPVKTLTEWLMDSGRDDMAPGYRRDKVEENRARESGISIPEHQIDTTEDQH